MAEEVTLEDVAKAAGVSRATASRALNGRAGVASDVRDRVRRVADSLNYRPNRAAQNLAGGRTRVVGLVLGGQQLQTDRYAASLVQAVATAADSFDEGLMLLLASNEPGRTVQNLLRDGLVDGVVVSAVATTERWVHELLDAPLPKVTIGSLADRDDLHVVDVENCESSATIVGHLLDSGCERIGIVTGPLDRVDAQQRLEGFRRAHGRHDRRVDEALIQVGTFDREAGYDCAKLLLDADVDAIFASNDEMAVGALRAVHERGLSCPADVSIAGFDGNPLIEVEGVRLTTVVQPFDELAHLAMGSLVALIEKREVPFQQIVTPQVRFGETTLSPKEPTSI